MDWLPYLPAGIPEWAIWTAVAVLLTLPGAACCWLAQRLNGVRVAIGSLDRVEERMTKLCSAVELLTDTTESSLRDAFAEIERLSTAGVAAPAQRRAAVRRRVKKAVEGGESARDVAVEEGVAEGEAHLRMRLEAVRNPPPGTPAVN